MNDFLLLAARAAAIRSKTAADDDSVAMAGAKNLGALFGSNFLIGEGVKKYIKGVAMPHAQNTKTAPASVVASNAADNQKLLDAFNAKRPGREVALHAKTAPGTARGIGLGPHYNPLNRSVNLDGRTVSPGVMAHELGHAKQPFMDRKGLGTAHGALVGNSAVLGRLYGTLAPLFRSDASEGRRDATIGTAMIAPQILKETGASLRGYNMMRRVLPTRGRMGAATAFVGLPSYLGMAAMPFGVHGAKSLLGGYNDEAAPVKPPDTLAEKMRTAENTPKQASDDLMLVAVKAASLRKEGRAALAGLGLLGAGGVALGAMSGRGTRSPVPVAPPEVIPPSIEAQMNPREVVRRSVASRMAGGVGNFWGRMKKQYSKPRPIESEDEL